VLWESDAKPALALSGGAEPLWLADEPGDGRATVTDEDGGVWRSGSGAGVKDGGSFDADWTG
jgi:hypothetical protein